MKIIAPLLVIYAMMCFTDPDGFAVWIDRQQVVSVARPHDCVHGANAKISTGNGTFVCVREGVREAIDRLDGKPK